MVTATILLLLAAAASTIAFTPPSDVLTRHRRGATDGAKASSGSSSFSSSSSSSGSGAGGFGGGGFGGGSGGYPYYPGSNQNFNQGGVPFDYQALFRQFYEHLQRLSQLHSAYTPNYGPAFGSNSIDYGYGGSVSGGGFGNPGGYGGQGYQQPNFGQPGGYGGSGFGYQGGQAGYGGQQGFGIPAGFGNRGEFGVPSAGFGAPQGGYAAPAGHGGSQGGYVAPVGQAGGQGGYVAPAGQAGGQGGYVAPAGQAGSQGGYVAPAGQAGSQGGFGGNQGVFVSTSTDGVPGGAAGLDTRGAFAFTGSSSDGPVGAQASVSLGTRGGFGQAEYYPPELGSRIGQEIPPPSGGNYAVFSSSSSGSSDVNGKKTSFKEATIGVNDNGKVSTYSVKNP